MNPICCRNSRAQISYSTWSEPKDIIFRYNIHRIWVWWLFNSRIPVDSILEAVFTVSPNRQYLGIVKPTTPATQGPTQGHACVNQQLWLYFHNDQNYYWKINFKFTSQVQVGKLVAGHLTYKKWQVVWPVWSPIRIRTGTSGMCLILNVPTALRISRAMLEISAAWRFSLGTGKPDATM